jgi:4-diphosphocytidyl-2C-methyl-D-erythritol kinase
LRGENVNEGGRYLTNDLYIPALHLNPDVEKAYNEALSFSPLGAVMTGSGSCVLAWFETKELCQWAQSRYRGKFRTYVVETIVPDYTKTKKTFGLKNPFVLSEEEISAADGDKETN